MATLVILKGLPCSGKTEFANKWVSEKQKRIRISWTELLASMGKGPARLMKPLAIDAACRLMVQALRQGCDVILDELNLYPPEFAPFTGRASMERARIEWKAINPPLEEIKKRNAQSEHPVREMELDRLAEKYKLWLK